MKLPQNFFLLIAIAALPFVGLAQNYTDETEMNPKTPLKERIVFGGNLGLSFGTITYIEVAPLVGYRVTPAFTSGIGLRYIYYKDKYYDYETNIYGGSIFGRYNLFKGIFAEADLEANNLEAYNPFDGTLTRLWVPSLLLGGGYSSAVGNSAGFYISVLYDVLQDPNSPYFRQPIIRLGFGVGL